MSLIFNNTTVKKAYFNNTKLKSIYYNNVKVWSGASNVTYIYAGNSVTEEVEEGSNAASKTVSISGATFLGWTTQRGSTSPSGTITATGDSMTLYAIYRFNDSTDSIINSSYYDPGWNVYGEYYNYDLTYTNIDMSKYYAATIHLKGYVENNWEDDYWYLYLNGGGNKTLIGITYVNDGVQHPASFDKDVTVTFNSASGNTKLSVTNECGGGNGSGGIVATNCRLLGRTVCS